MRNATAQDNNITLEARIFFILIVIVVAPLGLLLYFFHSYAPIYWAWEIEQARTSVLVGSVYIAATLYYLLLLRQRDWLAVHSSLGGLSLFSVWLLAAAAIHWNSFYPYRIATLFWLLAYYLPPLYTPILGRFQRERKGEVSLAGIRISPGWRLWMRARLLFYIPMAFLGFLFAAQLAPLWPWPIEVVNIRMFTGQIAAFGGYLGLVMKEALWRRIRLGMVFTAILGSTQLLGLVIQSEMYHWLTPIGILLPLIFLEWIITPVAMSTVYGRA